jgi:hypothetical protein
MRLPPARAGVVLCLALLSAAAPGAQTPRVAAFTHQDSLAVTIDCAPLLSDERRDRLHEGYPLSFILELSLMRHDPVWFDTQVLSREARFRITYEKWDERYRFALSDFSGVTTEAGLERLGDVLLELEDRLFTTLAPLADLDPKVRYYCAVAVEYRNLTLEDVKSAEQWLRGGAQRDSSAALGSRTLGEEALGLLWDLAGLKGERHKVATPKFRLSQLRRLE